MGVLSARELEFASDAFKDMKEDVEILIVRDGNEELCREFEDIAKELAGLTEKIKIEEGERDGMVIYPALILKKGDRENIIYHALPLKNEFKAFIDTIVNLSRGETELGGDALEELEKNPGSAEIITFITPTCPFCARVVSRSNNMAIAGSNIISRVVDVTCFKEMGNKHNIMSAPVTLINNRIKLEGELTEEEIAGWIVIAGQPDYWYHYAGELLKEGHLEKVMAMIRHEKDKAPLLGRLIGYPSFNTRLGTLVILEDLFQEDPESARKAVPGLVEALDDPEPSIRGDAATALGIVGDASAIPLLEKLLDDEYEDVREVAQDAISQIKERGN